MRPDLRVIVTRIPNRRTGLVEPGRGNNNRHFNHSSHVKTEERLWQL
jgi:hypothetical protein